MKSPAEIMKSPLNQVIGSNPKQAIIIASMMTFLWIAAKDFIRFSRLGPQSKFT